MRTISNLGLVNTRAINTSGTDTSCDVCGRTLLRGESAELYINGGARKAVCDLCTSRAVHEGWMREGTVAEFDPADAPERRRSLRSRLRGRRAAPTPSAATSASAVLIGEGRSDGVGPQASPALGPRTEAARSLLRRLRGRRVAADAAELPEASLVGAGERPWSEPAPVGARARDLGEPQQVHAVPVSRDQKIASAVELFNGCEHRRTLAGIARSLGLPTVAVLPSEDHSSVVEVVISWELCWYRYEVDLSEDEPHVRVGAQGYELDELAESERSANAAADESGGLTI